MTIYHSKISLCLTTLSPCNLVIIRFTVQLHLANPTHQTKIKQFYSEFTSYLSISSRTHASRQSVKTSLTFSSVYPSQTSALRILYTHVYEDSHYVVASPYTHIQTHDMARTNNNQTGRYIKISKLQI